MLGFKKAKIFKIRITFSSWYSLQCMVNLTCHPSWRSFDFSSSILSFQLKMEWSCLAFEWTCLKSCWWQIWRVNSHQVVDCSPTRNMKLYLSRGHFSLSPFTCLLSACIACYNPLPVIPSLDVGWNWYFNREENWARANLHLHILICMNASMELMLIKKLLLLSWHSQGHL